MTIKSFTIGIAGGTGAGKTYFLHQLAQKFSPSDICIFSQDNYYKSLAEQFVDENGVVHFDLPTAINHARFAEDLRKLKEGKSVQLKSYTFNNPLDSAQTIELKSAPIIIAEGLFVQTQEEVARELDLKIFIEASDDVRLQRRTERDGKERGYDADDVRYRFFNHASPIYQSVIAPLKLAADVIIPNNTHPERALEMLTYYLKSKIG